MRTDRRDATELILEARMNWIKRKVFLLGTDLREFGERKRAYFWVGLGIRLMDWGYTGSVK